MKLVIPRQGAHINGRRPTVEDYVQSMLTTFRANVKRSTMFTAAGRTEVRSNGERLIYGPSGDVIGRVVESPEGHTQVEESDRLHAVIRPNPVTAKFTP